MAPKGKGKAAKVPAAAAGSSSRSGSALGAAVARAASQQSMNPLARTLHKVILGQMAWSDHGILIPLFDCFGHVMFDCSGK